MSSFVKVKAKNAQKTSVADVGTSSHPKARCCHCGKTFYAPGPFAPQQCSHCHGDTSEEAYDRKALQLLSEVLAEEGRLHESERQKACVQEKIDRLSRWPLLRVFGRLHSRKLALATENAQNAHDAVKRQPQQNLRPRPLNGGGAP